MDSLQRTLLNGKPRSQFLACLYHSATGVRVGVKTTNKYGKFKMDVSSLSSGLYELRYYGDGIQPTVKDGNGDVVSQDLITPWEYEIEIFESSVAFDTTPPVDSEVNIAELET